ncbi:hypothetical protein FUT87_27950 [Mitsuaria sp. TWR114]|nr:hypothetical protein FUT87_27950 [Mitsuaria sp. TWR114]
MNRLLISVLLGLLVWNVSTALLIDLYVPSPCDASGHCEDDLGLGILAMSIVFGTFWLTAIPVLLYNGVHALLALARRRARRNPPPWIVVSTEPSRFKETHHDR